MTHKLLISVFCVLAVLVVSVGPAHAQAPNPGVDPARIVAALMALHPDVVSGCDVMCVENSLRSTPELERLSAQSGLPRDDVVKAWLSYNFELGERERLTHNSPPDQDWWVETHPQRLAAFSFHFGGLP